MQLKVNCPWNVKITKLDTIYLIGILNLQETSDWVEIICKHRQELFWPLMVKRTTEAKPTTSTGNHDWALFICLTKKVAILELAGKISLQVDLLKFCTEFFVENVMSKLLEQIRIRISLLSKTPTDLSLLLPCPLILLHVIATSFVWMGQYHCIFTEVVSQSYGYEWRLQWFSSINPLSALAGKFFECLTI